MINPEIQVVFVDFPSKGNEAVTKNEDDTYTIFLNARLSRERQFLAYKHALEHIQKCDFEKSNADKIESTRHNSELSEELEPWTFHWYKILEE